MDPLHYNFRTYDIEPPVYEVREIVIIQWKHNVYLFHTLLNPSNMHMFCLKSFL